MDRIKTLCDLHNKIEGGLVSLIMIYEKELYDHGVLPIVKDLLEQSRQMDGILESLGNLES